MTRRTAKKTVETPPEPSKEVTVKKEPTPQELAALERYKARNANVPPGLTFTKTEDGALSIDTDEPDRQHGMVLLLDSLGTADSDFFTGYIRQVVNAVSKNDIDTNATNEALAFIRGVKPRDEVEASLAAQMMATHNAMMTFASRLNRVETITQQDSAITAFNKLARTYAVQVETLKKYRATGEQRVVVQHQHVTVEEGGQAVVAANMTTGGGQKGNERE